MKKLAKINERIKNTGLELTGSRSNYTLVPIYDEGSVFFRGYEFMQTKVYPNLNRPLKAWLKSARILESKIKRILYE